MRNKTIAIHKPGAAKDWAASHAAVAPGPALAAIHGGPLSVIVDRGNLDIHFQPIISLKRKTIMGMEALARPREVDTGRPVSPLELFSWADQAGRMVELDRLCRNKALAAFSPMLETPQSP